jgi:hypothetical protein
MKRIVSRLLPVLTLSLLGAACSSSPAVKTTAYAALNDHRTFEYEFPVVWKAIEEVFRGYKVTDRDPEEVTPLEMRQLARRTLKTEWSYGKSRDKYQEYKVNGTPRKINLQERTRFTVDAHKVMGGVEVKVRSEEEVERLKTDGSSDGYHTSEQPDSSRVDEILNKINAQVLAAPPTGDAH